MKKGAKRADPPGMTDSIACAAPAWSPHDYIATLISWRRESVLAMCRQIEQVHSRHWIKAIASERRFSECMLYGRFADEVEEGARHFHGAEEWRANQSRWWG